jgi:hypothetical protein
MREISKFENGGSPLKYVVFHEVFLIHVILVVICDAVGDTGLSVHALEMQPYEVQTYEIQTYKIQVYKVQAYKI